MYVPGTAGVQKCSHIPFPAEEERFSSNTSEDKRVLREAQERTQLPQGQHQLLNTCSFTHSSVHSVKVY